MTDPGAPSLHMNKSNMCLSINVTKCLSLGDSFSLAEREIRRRDAKSGHQTAILSTDNRSEKNQLVAVRFAHCQHSSPS